MSETPTDRTAAAMLDELVERQFREWLYARPELVGDIPDERRELMREAFRGDMLRGLTSGVTVRRSCSWCDEMVTLNTDGSPVFCPSCHHRGDVARMRCTCERCRPPGRLVPPAEDD
jgi:hypothetical protein